MNISKVLVFLLVIIARSNSAHILGIVPIPSYSHQIAFQPLWRELSLRGHQVTSLTTEPINDPTLVNLTEIDLHFSYDAWNAIVLETIESTQESTFKGLTVMLRVLDKISQMQLEHPEVQNLLHNSDVKFDLVMVEFYAPVMFAFSEKFNCPFIGLTSLEAQCYVLKMFGNPTHPILYPNNLLPFSDHLTFTDRVKSVVFSIVFEIYTNYYYYSLQQKLVQRFFGNNYSHVRDIASNVSLMFINSDPVFYKVKPYLPNVIQIGGGSHRTAAKPLPKELKRVLDSANDGIIYFSLGSNVKSADIPIDVKSLILSVFAELPFIILWKFEADDLPNKPKNVIISKWFPQQDIFRHPNIKLFITQGGVQSMDEGIYNHIPMIGIPFFGDQYNNVQRMVERGFGLSLDYTKLEKNEFKDTILEVINNTKYRRRIRELAELAADVPMTGLDKAVWWTEYVIRHKGAKILRSPFLDIPSYQYYLLDVIGVLLIFAAISMYILYIALKLLLRYVKYVCFPRSKPKIKTN